MSRSSLMSGIRRGGGSDQMIEFLIYNVQRYDERRRDETVNADRHYKLLMFRFIAAVDVWSGFGGFGRIVVGVEFQTRVSVLQVPPTSSRSC